MLASIRKKSNFRKKGDSQGKEKYSITNNYPLNFFIEIIKNKEYNKISVIIKSKREPLMINLSVKTSVANNRLNLMFRPANQKEFFNPDSRQANGLKKQKQGIALANGISGIFQRLFGKTERIVVVTKQEDGSQEQKIFRVNKNSLNKYLASTSAGIYMARTTESITPEKSSKMIKVTILSPDKTYSQETETQKIPFLEEDEEEKTVLPVFMESSRVFQARVTYRNEHS